MNGEEEALRATGIRQGGKKRETELMISEKKEKSNPKIKNLVVKGKKNTVIDPELMKKEEKPKKKKSREKKSTKKFKSFKGMSRLDRYNQYDRNNVHNQIFPAIEGFKGPLSKRKSTNCFCLLVPILMISFLGVHFGMSVMNGWPTELVRPRDFRGQICGVGRHINRPYLYFLAPTVDLNVGMCVEKCPEKPGTQICLYDGKTENILTHENFCYTQIECDTHGMYCYPQETEPRELVDAFLSKPEAVLRRMIGDLFLTWDIVLLVFIVLFFIAFGISALLRKKKGIKIAVWGCLGMTVVVAELFGFFCWNEREKIIALRCLFGENRHECGQFSAKFYLILAIIFWTVGLLYMIWMGCLFNRINLAIGFFTASLNFTKKLKEIKWLPLYGVIATGGMMMVLLWTIFESSSIVEKKIIEAKQIDGNAVVVYDPNYTLTTFLPVDLIVTIFFTIFFVSWTEFMSTYAICVWFFSLHKDTINLDPGRVLKHSLKYHMGFIAFLSISKLIFGPIKWVTQKIYNTLADAKQTRLGVRFFQACCFPCLFLHYKFLRFISKISFVQLSMWNDPYRKAAKRAYFLVKVRNFDRGIGNDELIEFVLSQIKISIGAMAAILVHLYQLYVPKSPTWREFSQLECFVTAPLIAFVFTIPYVSGFTGSLEMAIKSIVQCRMIDEEMHVGEQRYATEEEKKIMEYWKSKFDSDALDAGARGKKKEVGEIVVNDGMYEELAEEEEDYTPPMSESDSEADIDNFDERKRRVFNKEREFIIDEEEQKKKNDLRFSAVMRKNSSESVELKDVRVNPHPHKKKEEKKKEPDNKFDFGDVEAVNMSDIEEEPKIPEKKFQSKAKITIDEGNPMRNTLTKNEMSSDRQKRIDAIHAPHHQEEKQREKKEEKDPYYSYKKPEIMISKVENLKDEHRSMRSRKSHKSSKSRKKRDKDLLGDLNLDDNKSRKSKKSKHSKHSKKEKKGDFFDELERNRDKRYDEFGKSSKSKKSKKSRKIDLDDLGLDDRKSHKSKKSKKRKHDNFFDELEGVSKHREGKTHKSKKSKRSKDRRDGDALLNKMLAHQTKERKNYLAAEKDDGEFFDNLSGVLDDKEEDLMIMNASRSFGNSLSKKKGGNDSTIRIAAPNFDDEDGNNLY